jgi:hypothetical protein
MESPLEDRPSARSRRQDLAFLAAFTLLLHVPFLNQAVEGDEINYLDFARHILIRPLAPFDFQYVFHGKWVQAAGHPHPPLDSYLLALAWKIRGHFSIHFFHVFYLTFALGISFATYAIAARFTRRPLWAALLAAASPLIQVNTNTLASPESPGLALLLSGAAAFFWRRFLLSGLALTLAGLTELQALALGPILLLEYGIRRKRPPLGAWLAALAPFAGLAAWNAFQLALMHQVPAALLSGYARSASGLRLKAASATALLQHLGVLIIPLPLAWRRLWGIAPGLLLAFCVSDYTWWERVLLVLCMTLGVNALMWLWSARRIEPALAAWCLLYFGFACLAFFAGASRYLLPLTAPMIVLFVRRFESRPRWLKVALAVNLLLGLNISFAAYEFSRVYAEVPPPPGRPFLINGDWGFRYYLLERGGRVLAQDSVPQAGEWIVSSQLSMGENYDSLAEEAAAPLRVIELPVRTPLRLIDLHAHSGFSTVSAGLLPFSFSWRPIDRITYSRTSSFLNAPVPWVPTQFSGRLVYLPEAGRPIRLPLECPGTLRFTLFGKGRGPAKFVIRRASGAVVFERLLQVDGEAWEPHQLSAASLTEALLSVDAPPKLRTGWGELVCDANAGPLPDVPALTPLSSFSVGDLRARPQLLSGWYGVEEGSWRWMAREAEVALAPPADGPLVFEMQLYLPPGHMARAGGSVTVSILAGGQLLGAHPYTEPGSYSLVEPLPRELVSHPLTKLTIRLNRAVPPGKGDRRELGLVVQRLGLAAK